MRLKEVLYTKCLAFIEESVANIEKTIHSNKRALLSETKSSAGDKHETGRAMIQLEMEKAGKQLAVFQSMRETLVKMDIARDKGFGCLGSIIETNTFIYFLSVAAGKLVVDKETYYAVSVSSPIGRLLLGKKEKDRVFLNGKEIEIVKVY